ncbi:venom serine carboxypeptidase-like [Cimex lectularius]|uniref:Carboxypeptidase n=1 Tax=Cimex lectularius TaxID=79782 RepID=A0A8I6RGV1_CIMLE|nr:venom serine carboxypeptidase-like [Cimex lectularius]
MGIIKSVKLGFDSVMFQLLFLALYLPTTTLAVKPKEYGKAIFLTPFIERNKIDIALNQSRVLPLKGSDVVSHAGFLTVNKAYNSCLFMWFFESETTPEYAPVVLWLQGGPGSSALQTIFQENGRYYLKPSKGVGLRKHYLSQSMNTIYIDSPVGTGFSFTDRAEGYSRDENQAAADLYKALVQIFQLFEKYRRNEFFIVGQEYGGKLAISLAELITEKNQNNVKKINLKGLAIGNGLFDPISMVDSYANLLYTIGLIDLEWKKQFETKQAELKRLIGQNQFSNAVDTYIDMLIGNENSMFKNVTGYKNSLNYLQDTENSLYGTLEYNLKEKPFLRNATHVGYVPFNDGVVARDYLKDSIMQSVKPNLEKLLPKYRVLVYSGQLNIMVPYVAISKFLNSLKWSGSWSFKLAPRKLWIVDGAIAGYCKHTKTLSEVMIKDAGQLVSFDQPKLTKEMIVKFTTNTFTECS